MPGSTVRWPGRVLTAGLALSHVLLSAQAAPCNDMWPAWSPDGRQIVFVSDRAGGDPEVYVETIGNAVARRLTTTPGRDAHPSFSPDGRQIAFQSPRGDGHTNLYVMNADGSNQQRVTRHTGFAGVPVWSPDGTHLAYQWRPEGDGQKWRLMMVEPSTGQTRELSNGSSNDQVVNWAPTGGLLVFHSDRQGKNQIYTTTGGGVTRLLRSEADDHSAAFSPDGRLIAFRSDRNGTPNGVYLAAADGSGIRRLGLIAPAPGVPFFSPDGLSVLATSVGPAGTEIHRVRIRDGMHERIVACRPLQAKAGTQVIWPGVPGPAVWPDRSRRDRSLR